MKRKQTTKEVWKTVADFQGVPDIAGMALIVGEGKKATIAAGNFLLAKARTMPDEKAL